MWRRGAGNWDTSSVTSLIYAADLCGLNYVRVQGTAAMKSRFDLFQHKPTGKPVVVRTGWSWSAFLFAPLWAASHALWGAALGMSLLATAVAYAVVTGHESRTVLISAWLLLSWWMADGGHRWVRRRILSSFGEGELMYLGGELASSPLEAEEQARLSIEIRDRFFAAARNAPPEHVAQALSFLNQDAL